MNVNLNLEQLTELNQIRGLLLSSDFESQVLGFEMFKNSNLFRNKIYDLSYELKNGKQIPLSWFIRKAEEIITKRVNTTRNSNIISPCCENFISLILPIIDSVLLCESKFVGKITFNIDKNAIMKTYVPNSILDKYSSPIEVIPQTETSIV